MLTIDSQIFKLVTIYLLNLILDYPLQSAFEAKWKAKSYYVLFVHSCIWGLGISFCLVLWDGGIEYWKVAMLVFGHMLMDGFKSRRLYLNAAELKIEPIDYGKEDYAAYMIDQAFHVGQLLVALYC